MNMYQVKILKTDNCGIIPRPPLTMMIKTTWKSMKAKISFNPVQASAVHIFRQLVLKPVTDTAQPAMTELRNKLLTAILLFLM